MMSELREKQAALEEVEAKVSNSFSLSLPSFLSLSLIDNVPP